MAKQQSRWTEWELTLLKALRNDMNYSELGEIFGKSREATRKALNRFLGSKEQRRVRRLSKTWSSEEKEFIRNNYERMSDAQLGQALGRSRAAVADHRKRVLKLPRFAQWTDEEENLLKEIYGTMANGRIGAMMGRKGDAVQVKAYKLGLTDKARQGETYRRGYGKRRDRT